MERAITEGIGLFIETVIGFIVSIISELFSVFDIADNTKQLIIASFLGVSIGTVSFLFGLVGLISYIVEHCKSRR